MRRDSRIRLVASAVVVVAILMFTGQPWQPAASYHAFADTRPMAGIPNAANVLSNLAFVLVGLTGMRLCWQGNPRAHALPWSLFFCAVTLTGLGSAIYHIAPADEGLLWDRLPLGLALAAFIAAAVTEHVGLREGLLSLPVLLLYALLSVVAWCSIGDLRYYVALQVVAIVVIPVLCALLPGPYTRGRDWTIAVGIYGGAKIAEICDQTLYAAGHIISGHTLKHLLAALAVGILARMLRLRLPKG